MAEENKDTRMIAVYARVSTKDKQSNDAQLNSLSDYLDSRGIKKGEFEVRFDKCSGLKEERPGLDEIRNLIRQNKVSELIVYSLSRWGRSVPHILEMFEECKKYNVVVRSLSEGIISDGAMGEFLITILTAVARLETEWCRERTIAGLEEAKRKGKKLGRPKNSPDKKKRDRRAYYGAWDLRKKKNEKVSPYDLLQSKV